MWPIKRCDVQQLAFLLMLTFKQIIYEERPGIPLDTRGRPALSRQTIKRPLFNYVILIQTINCVVKHGAVTSLRLQTPTFNRHSLSILVASTVTLLYKKHLIS